MVCTDGRPGLSAQAVYRFQRRVQDIEARGGLLVTSNEPSSRFFAAVGNQLLGGRIHHEDR